MIELTQREREVLIRYGSDPDVITTCSKRPKWLDELMAVQGHSSTYIDSEGEWRCECGKWLEPGYYEMEDHLKSVFRDATT